MNKKSQNFLDVISRSELPNIVKDLAEIPIDSKIPDKLLKEIPILRTILGIFSVGKSIKEFLFTKKLSIFLTELYKTKQKTRVS